MPDIGSTSGSCDPHNLARFVAAQQGVYDRALAEIKSGRKSSHWMWFIFPQIAGLGYSTISRQYAIESLSEAWAFLKHPLLGPRLVEITEAVLALQGQTAHQIFGSPDDLKLRSCATLFAEVSPAASVFHQLLEKYYDGEPDRRTLTLLKTGG